MLLFCFYLGNSILLLFPTRMIDDYDRGWMALSWFQEEMKEHIGFCCDIESSGSNMNDSRHDL
jgi:hypothetical protein